MKIGIIFDGLKIGGIERIGINYIKLLLEIGHEVDVFNLNSSFCEMEQEIPLQCKIFHWKFPHILSPELYSKLVKKSVGFKVIYPLIYIGVSIVNLFYKGIFRMKETFRKQYDVVIAFSGHYNDLTFVSSNFLRCKKKMCWLHGALYGYALISDGYLNLYNKIKNLIVLVDTFQEEVLLVNKQLDLSIQKLYNPSFIAEKSIDKEKIAKLRKKYGKFLLMIGRLDKDKDQLTLIKAIEYIRDKYDFAEKLVLVGDGERKEELEDYVISNGLEETVFFEGSQIDVQNYYSAAYLFTHSSPLEGLPTTLIEALFFNLPIVSTDSLPGVREILGNNEYGLVVPVSDAEKMGEEIYRIYSDERLYHLYATKGKEKFEEFSPEKIKDTLKNILIS